jgi:hypothetical protein
MPDGANYDFLAVKLLEPFGVVSVDESTGIAGSEDWHFWDHEDDHYRVVSKVAGSYPRGMKTRGMFLIKDHIDVSSEMLNKITELTGGEKTVPLRDVKAQQDSDEMMRMHSHF